MVEVIVYILFTVLLAVFVVGFWRLRYAFKHFKQNSFVTSASMIDDMPGVTVCIPARNEMHAMTECLQRLIESNYPKLEIIVLDDLSGDDTSVLIKSFAHEGVRFVEGSALPDGWLGKNYALQGLLKEASGTYVLFMDVDTRLSPDSIEQLVAYAQNEKALMVSVLPRREDGWRASVIFSPLRYFWELMFHRASAPATASNAWLIDRRTLIDRWQGFAHFKAAIQPESRFSAELMATNQYRFLIGTESLGVSYEKKWRSQVATSIRLLFPLVGAKIPHAVIVGLDLLILAGPLFVLIAGIFAGFGILQIIAALFWLMFAGLYASYLRKVWKRGWWVGGLLWGFIVIQEAILVAVSAWGYHKRVITWKGRLVKVPKVV
ncbi:MAG: glycosyltransferase family 2 protein [Candidatus Microsaccharimonas sp.]